jgi:uncharacterized protein (DUF2249 family)
MKTQIERLIKTARIVADAHEKYRIIGEIVRHTPNVRVYQLNADKKNEFTSVYFESGRKEFKVNFSNYRGATLEFNFHENIEQELDSLIFDVEESLVDWLSTYPEEIEQRRMDAVEKKRQALIRLTNEINEMEGKL